MNIFLIQSVFIEYNYFWKQMVLNESDCMFINCIQFNWSLYGDKVVID